MDLSGKEAQTHPVPSPNQLPTHKLRGGVSLSVATSVADVDKVPAAPPTVPVHSNESHIPASLGSGTTDSMQQQQGSGIGTSAIEQELEKRQSHGRFLDAIVAGAKSK